jgi:hypothetical protein
VVNCTHEAEWAPFQTHYSSESPSSAGNRTPASRSVSGNSAHWTTAAVNAHQVSSSYLSGLRILPRRTEYMAVVSVLQVGTAGQPWCAVAAARSYSMRRCPRRSAVRPITSPLLGAPKTWTPALCSSGGSWAEECLATPAKVGPSTSLAPRRVSVAACRWPTTPQLRALLITCIPLHCRRRIPLLRGVRNSE